MEWYWLAFAILLYFLCAGLIVAEVFVPSGGIISICALGCLGGGIWIFFKYSPVAGWVGVVLAVIMIPSMLVFAYRLLPKTRFGRAVSLEPPQRESGDAVPDTEHLRGLLGKEGVVLTPLRPVGMCDFDGRRVECVAESGYVGRDKRVKVIHTAATQVTVRAVEDS